MALPRHNRCSVSASLYPQNTKGKSFKKERKTGSDWINLGSVSKQSSRKMFFTPLEPVGNRSRLPVGCEGPHGSGRHRTVASHNVPQCLTCPKPVGEKSKTSFPSRKAFSGALCSPSSDETASSCSIHTNLSSSR